MTSNTNNIQSNSLRIGQGLKISLRAIMTISVFVICSFIILNSQVQAEESKGAIQGTVENRQAEVLPVSDALLVADDSTPVVISKVHQDNFDVYLYGLGVIKPLNTVKVTSRVDGQLLSVKFKEGQKVRKGDLLAQIDPKPFEVKLKLAQGRLVRDKALLEKAKIDLKRYHTLLSQDSVSPQTVDSKESQLGEYQAAVIAGEGGVMDAQLQLSYARIIAPISGRLGFRQVDPGNIMVASDARGLVTITQVDPTSVVFSIPEDELPRVTILLRGKKNVKVQVYDRALKEKLGEGRLIAIDNQIDVTTGTVKLKAKLANPNGMLFANQFVNVKMVVETRPKTMLVSTDAIQRGINGNFVYVINENNIAVVTPVELGPEQDHITVIEKGVTPEDRVVIEGADRLRDGEKVKIITRNKTTEQPSSEQQGNKSTDKIQSDTLKPHIKSKN